jgi:hypothetical protein
MTALKPWRQVVTPHADIRHGKFDASVFAADLGESSLDEEPLITEMPRRSSRRPI